MTPKVVIHADSSPDLGTGHVARAIALGQALLAEGAQVELASAELVSAQRRDASSRGMLVVPRWRADHSPHMVVVDGYHLSLDSRKEFAGPGVPITVVDDLGQDASDATFLVNGNLYARPGSWGRAGADEALLGPTYAIMGPEYADAVPERGSSAIAERVLVTMGGADPTDATKVALDALAEGSADLAVRVVIGPAHPRATERAQQARRLGFTVEAAPSSLHSLLAWTDLVLSACGTTVLEAARLGRPLVGIVIAENQRRVAEAVTAEQLGIVAGRHPGVSSTRLIEAVTALRSDQAARSAIIERGPSLVDGLGARRVARALLSGPVTLRDVSGHDAELLLAWRNDPATRQASFAAGAIAGGEHRRWLGDALRDPQQRLWLGEIGGTSVGVIRLKLEDGIATVSVTVAPGRRSFGIGSRLISAGMLRLQEEGMRRTVDAWIRPENEASVRAFHRAGFREAPSPYPDRRLLRSAVDPMG